MEWAGLVPDRITGEGGPTKFFLIITLNVTRLNQSLKIIPN